MDHFFKAHSSKTRIPNMQRKSKRIKSSLRLMLNGYDRNDADAIRTAAVERASTTEDSDCDYTLNGDSDLEQMQPCNIPSLVPSATSSGSVAHSIDSAQPSPDRSPASSHAASTYSSCTGREDVGRLMILNSHSDEEQNDYSIVNASELDSSIQELDVYDIIDSSLDNTNTSSSPISEFDCDGKLASRIIEKLNAGHSEIKKGSACQNEEESECKINTAPSVSGFVTRVNRKRPKRIESVEMLVPKVKKFKKLKEYTESLTPYFSDESNLDQSDESQLSDVAVPEVGKSRNTKNVASNSKTSVLKIKKSKNKQNDSEESPSYVSFDASDLELPSFLSSFRDYKFCTSKNVTPRASRSVINSSKIFQNEQKLKNTQINECTNEALSVSYESKGSKPEQDTTEDVVDTLHFDEEFVNGVEVNIEAPTSIEVHLLNNSCIVVLRHPTEFYIHGKVNVSGLCGTIDIMGYKLEEKNAQVYAPRFSFAQTVKTVATECSKYDLCAKLTLLGMARPKTDIIIDSLQKFDAIIQLQSLPDRRLNFVEKEFSSADFFHMSNKMLANEQFPEAARMLSCSLYAHKPYKSFAENGVWPEVVKYGMGRNSKGIICGGKGTGKSTFLKYYINRMMSQGAVAVIDLDPGQAEFTVAGNISITVVTDPVIGPNFTHLQKPRRMLNMGLINVLDNVERYVLAVTQLLRHAMEDEECSQLPWIVNTMGMSNSLGLKLITYIVLLLKPTFLVQMDSNVQKNCFEMLLTPTEIQRVYSETYEQDEMFASLKCPEEFNFQYYMSSYPKIPRGENLTAKDKRYMCFLSYFGGALSKSMPSLLGVRPYVVQLTSVSIVINCKVDEDAVTSIINGKIVALCENTSNAFGKTFTEEDAIICHGHGLVRGVDLERESLYIISREQREVLSLVNVLLYCEAHPDLPLSDEGLPTGTLVPYRAPLKPHNKQLMKSPKRRFNPLQLLKIKRASSSNRK